MFMERGQIPRQQRNVGTERELRAFNPSARHILLKTLNPSTSGQIMGQIQSNAADRWNCKEVNASLQHNLGNTAP